MSGRQLLRVSLPFATFGLDVQDGQIVAPSAPIARWCIGKSAAWCIAYWTRRGGRCEWVNLG